jgi:hypothetical protein
MTERRPFSDYIVYVDESGDHGMETMDPSYPMFVLAFCIFRKDDYAQKVVPAVQDLKFRYFGHDLVILHEHEIRKQTGPFRILRDQNLRAAFVADVTKLMEEAPFTVVAAAIDKIALKRQYAHPANPYGLAVEFCLERLRFFLRDQKSGCGLTYVVFEGRGSREDKDLELSFRQACSGENPYRQVTWSYTVAGDDFPFEPLFAPKSCNSSGLQLADLAARPIGRHLLDPAQENRAYSVIERKLRRSSTGDVKGWGLKCFP